MPARPKLTPLQVNAIKQAADEGVSLRVLAARYGVSKSAIHWHLTHKHRPPPPHGTYARYQRHQRRGDPACDECKAVAYEYLRQLRKKKGSS